MRVVLDTNVVVSGLLKPHGKPAAILRLVAAGVLQVAYDQRILSEYRDVLARPKFPFSPGQINAFLEQIAGEGISCAALPLKTHLPDPDDAPFLEVALAAGAQALITGSIRHYPARSRQGMVVLDPAAFLARWRKLDREGRRGR